VRLSIRDKVLKFITSLTILAAIGLVSCSPVPDQPPVVKADKPFVSAGNIEMQMDGGDYTVRAAPDQRIRVTFSGNTGNATAELSASGSNANLAIRDTPHSNFRARVEVPAETHLAVHLSGGNLDIGGVAGNKDISSTAGNVEIAIANPNDYGSVDASVKAGNLDSGPFGGSGSGIGQHVKWSGPGKYALRASLGAGNLELKH
jgi:hypothetical protein